MNFKVTHFLTLLLIFILPFSVSAHGLPPGEGFAIISYLLLFFYHAPGAVISLILLLINRWLRSQEKGKGVKIFSWIVIICSIIYLLGMMTVFFVSLMFYPIESGIGYILFYLGVTFLVSLLVGKTGFDYWKLARP